MSQNFSGMANIIRFLAIALPLLFLVYLFSQNKNINEDTLRIGINQWPGYEYLFIAKKEGFFKQAGLNIELIELSSLAEVRRAFERGKVDAMASTLVEVLEAYKYSGRVAQSVLVTDYSNGADEVLGSPKIESIRDLKGKKIGVEAGSVSLYLVNRALQLNSIKPSEVMFIPMEPHEMISALKAGKVDAITSYPPASVTIKKLLLVNRVFDSSEIPGEIIDVVAIDRDVLALYPQLQTKLHQVWVKTLEFTVTNQEEAYRTLIENLPISIKEFKESMQHIYLVGADEQINFLKENGKVQQALENIGSIVLMHSDNENIDYSQFIYNKKLN